MTGRDVHFDAGLRARVGGAVHQELGRCPGLSGALVSAGVAVGGPVVRGLEPGALVNEVADRVCDREGQRAECRATVVAIAAHHVVGRRMGDGLWTLTVVDRRFINHAVGRVWCEQTAGDLVAQTGAKLHHGVWARGSRYSGHPRLYIHGALRNVIADYFGGPLYDQFDAARDGGLEDDLPGAHGEPARLSEAELRRARGSLSEGEAAALDAYLAESGPPDGMTPQAYRRRLSNALVRVRLKFAVQVGQEVLLDALASSAASHMKELSVGAWAAVTPHGLTRWLAVRDRRRAEDRGGVQRLLVVARRAADAQTAGLLQRFLDEADP